MSRLRRTLAGGLFQTKRSYDIHKMRWKRRLGWLEPVMIIPYRGYGTRHKLTFRGRIEEDKEFENETIGKDSSAWRNLRHMYRHFHSDEVPEARVRAFVVGRIYETYTDHEGFFKFDIDISSMHLEQKTWQPVDLELVEPKAKNQGPVRATAQVLTPANDVEFGIISDIDDTVIRTGATTLFRQWRTILFNNAYTRRPFAGIDAFYRALSLGANERSENPIFYVSSSSWNLYMLFSNILELHDIPAGPLMLRNYGLDRRKGISFGHRDHKIEQIRPILDMYPNLQFVLIGDSGQKDPEIYRELVHIYPDRIRAIYIRDVTSFKRDREVRAIAEELAALGVSMVLTEDTFGAAEHAAAHGLISSAALPHIRREKQEDEERRAQTPQPV